MPIRWRGIFIGTGCFLAGYVAAPMTAGWLAVSHMHRFEDNRNNLSKYLEQMSEDRAAKMREEVDRLEANGDSASWDKAQELKRRINEINTSRSNMAQQPGTEVAAQKLVDWSYQGSWSFGKGRVEPKPKEEEAVINGLVEGALQQLISDLEAKGDVQSVERAQDVRERLERIKRRQKVESQTSRYRYAMSTNEKPK